MSLSSPYQDPALCRALLDRLQTALDGRELRFMEVCGTHTVSIFQSGLRSLLPKEVTHLSGPGCPVCVTHDAEVAAFLDLAGRDGVIIATFGDLLRVPGPGGRSLKHAQAQGARIEIVYSPLDALNIAAANPGDTVVFLGIGFETTAPTVAATLMMAEQRKLDNFCVLSLHKLVPPVLRALLDDKDTAVSRPFCCRGTSPPSSVWSPTASWPRNTASPPWWAASSPWTSCRPSASWPNSAVMTPRPWSMPTSAPSATRAIPAPAPCWRPTSCRPTPCGAAWAPSRTAAWPCGPPMSASMP